MPRVLLRNRLDPDNGIVSHGMSIPQTHPRLWFNDARLAAARSWYASNPFTPSNAPERDRTEERALRSLLNVGNPSDQSTQALQAIANIMTAHEDGIDDPAGAGLLYEIVTTNPVASDDIRWYGQAIILTYDWCYPYWTAQQRADLISYFNTVMWHWADPPSQWGNIEHTGNDYHYGYFRNELMWGIASYGENPDAEAFLEWALVDRWQNNTKVYLAAANGTGHKGGIVGEGVQYGRYHLAYLTIPFVTMTLLGRDIYEETNFYKEAVFALIYQTLPDETYQHSNFDAATGPFWEVFPHSDDQNFRYGASAESHYYGDWMQGMVSRYGSTPMGEWARQWLNTVTSNTGYVTQSPFTSAIDAGSTARSWSTLPFDYYASGTQWFFTRNRWGVDATVINVQGGPRSNVGHDQFDYGSFQIWKKKRWVSRESTGYGNSTAFDMEGVGRTTLNGASNNSQTTLTPSAHWMFSASNGFRVMIDNECMQINTGAGTSSWSNIDRGVAGTTAASHSNGAIIRRIADCQLSECHNMIIMNGKGLAEDAPNRRAQPVAMRLQSHTDFSYYEIEMTGSYRNDINSVRDNSCVVHVRRGFLYIRSIDTFVVMDWLESGNSSSGQGSVSAASVVKMFVLHSETDPAIDGGTPHGATITNDTEVIRLITVVPTTPGYSKVDETVGGNNAFDAGQWRLEITQSGAAQQHFLHLLQMRTTSESNITASLNDTGTAFEVTIDHPTEADIIVTFLKAIPAVGSPTTGGSIQFGAGSPINFRSDVQGISVTTDGPAWAA